MKRISKKLVLTFLILTPLYAYMHQPTSQVDGHPVIRSFHLGPFAPSCSEDSCEQEVCEADSPCEENPCAQVPRYSHRPHCQYCIDCQYQYWCPYCGYCPIYDESDIIDEYDRHATWPSKHDDSWMRELAY